eukprot:Skav227428  [mRNA]  locus=scaffold1986:198688:210653:+ [translate_table: standard]
MPDPSCVGSSFGRSQSRPTDHRFPAAEAGQQLSERAALASERCGALLRVPIRAAADVACVISDDLWVTDHWPQEMGGEADLRDILRRADPVDFIGENSDQLWRHRDLGRRPDGSPYKAARADGGSGEPGRLVVQSYGGCASVRPGKRQYLEGDQHVVAVVAVAVVILDEAHKIKDPQSQRTKAILPLCNSAHRCILLSGTPVLNCAAETWTLMAALDTAMPSYETFCERYCDFKEVEESDGSISRRPVGARHGEELNQIFSSYMVRHKKEATGRRSDSTPW